MAKIHNSDIQKRIIEEAKLQVAVDNVPQELAEKVLPVLISNPKGKKKILRLIDNNQGGIFEVVLSVPAGKKWKFLGIGCQVGTDANVADRYVVLDIYPKDGSYSHYYMSSVGAQVASKQGYYTFLPSITASKQTAGDLSEFWIMPLPDVPLIEGDGIYLFLEGKQATDTLCVTMLIEEEELLLEEVDETIY